MDRKVKNSGQFNNWRRRVPQLNCLSLFPPELLRNPIDFKEKIVFLVRRGEPLQISNFRIHFLLTSPRYLKKLNSTIT